MYSLAEPRDLNSHFDPGIKSLVIHCVLSNALHLCNVYCIYNVRIEKLGNLLVLPALAKNVKTKTVENLNRLPKLIFILVKTKKKVSIPKQ